MISAIFYRKAKQSTARDSPCTAQQSFRVIHVHSQQRNSVPNMFPPHWTNQIKLITLNNHSVFAITWLVVVVTARRTPSNAGVRRCILVLATNEMVLHTLWLVCSRNSAYELSTKPKGHQLTCTVYAEHWRRTYIDEIFNKLTPQSNKPKLNNLRRDQKSILSNEGQSISKPRNPIPCESLWQSK